jgi:predicted O-methyltransferase YrrM
MRTSESVQQWLHYLFPDELVALKQIASTLPPNPTIVNIGAGGGTSGLAFMEARPQLDTNLITVDITDKSSPFGCLAAERQMFEEAGYPRGNQTWRQIHADSKTVKLDEPVDLVFIDGDHSYYGCAGDILNWWPQLGRCGIMAIHDYNKMAVYDGREIADAPHPTPWPGVDNAVHEFISIGNFETWYAVDTMAVFFASGTLEGLDSNDPFIYAMIKAVENLARLKPGQPCGKDCFPPDGRACHRCGRAR